MAGLGGTVGGLEIPLAGLGGTTGGLEVPLIIYLAQP